MQTVVYNKATLIQQLSLGSREIKDFGVKQLGFFGSFAKDANINSDSDVDFLVEFELGKKTYDNLSTYLFTLRTCWEEKLS